MPSSVKTNHLGCQQQLRDQKLREVLLHKLDQFGAFVSASDPLFSMAQFDQFPSLLFSEVTILKELVQPRQRLGSFLRCDLSVLGLDQFWRRVQPGDDFPEVFLESFNDVFFWRGFLFAQRSEVLADLGLLVELEELVVVSSNPGSTCDYSHLCFSVFTLKK